MTAEDIAGLNHLWLQFKPQAEALTLEVLRSALVDTPSNLLIVARYTNLLRSNFAGMAQLAMAKNLDGSRYGHVDNVVVDKQARGQGVGRELMLGVIAEARFRGLTRLELTSRPSREAANALYQKLGFELRETNAYRLKL